MSTEPRRPFQDSRAPEPFFQAPEFKRFAWLAGLVVMVVIGYALLEFSRVKTATTTAPEVARAKVEAFVPKEKLSPEQLEARAATLYSKFEGALTDSKNGDPLNQDTPGYWKLLETLIRYPPEEVEQRAGHELDWKTVMNDPDGWRGEFVHARALVVFSYAYKLARPVLGRRDVYRMIMTSDDPDEDHFFVAEVVDHPPELSPDRRFAADISGIVYRTVRYENGAGVMQEVPYLLVRNFREVPAASEGGMRAWLARNGFAVLGGMAVLVLAVRLLFSWFQHRSRRARVRSAPSGSIRDMLDKKLRAAGKVPPPTP